MAIDPEEVGRIVEVISQRGYVSVPKAAILLGTPQKPLHQQTVHSMIKSGRLRHIMVGKRKCVTWDEIKRFKEEGNWDPSKYPEQD